MKNVAISSFSVVRRDEHVAGAAVERRDDRHQARRNLVFEGEDDARDRIAEFAQLPSADARLDLGDHGVHTVQRLFLDIERFGDGIDVGDATTIEMTHWWV